MTKTEVRVISDDYESKPSVPYGDFAGVKPLITPPKIRRERTRLIELLVDTLQDYDACVRALARGEILPRMLCEADYDLALALNQVCYFDEEEREVRGEYYDSQSIIHHYEREAAKAKARLKRKHEAA